MYRFGGDAARRGRPRFDLREFGARGDGATDDYPAWLGLVAAVNAAGGGTVVIPPGSYHFARHITSTNGVRPVAFAGCRDLHIRGYGARLDLKGDFQRTRRGGGAALSPLFFTECTRFSVAGLEVDGNVDRATRESGTTEPFAYGLVTVSCSDYELRDLHLHHHQTDGLYLGHSMGSRGDRGASVTRVVCEYNARNGLSVSGLQGARFTGCAFLHSAKAAGRYGGHAPGYGVNIEPETLEARDIEFVDCRFAGNSSTQFGAGYPEKTSGLHVRGGSLDHRGSLATFAMIFSCVDGAIDGVRIDAGQGNVGLGYTDGPTSVRARVRMRGCRVEGTHYGVHVSVDGVEALIEDNDLVCTRTAPSAAYFPVIESRRARFVGNRVWVPRASYTREVGAADVVPRLRAGEARNNVYGTDLDGSGGSYFAVDYGDTRRVEGERFTAPNCGFRAGYGVS